MKKRIVLLLSVVTLSLCTACKDKEEKAVEELMSEIREDYARGYDEECLRTIDTLRSRHPKAIDARREALKIYQDASLRLAQKRLAVVDSALTVEQGRLHVMDSIVQAHKAESKATEEELTGLTLQRILCDSLQTQFDVLCAEIRFIKMKQKE